MTSIKIEPAGPRDLAMHRAQYDQLVAALQEKGYDAEIELWEQRGALQVAQEIAVHVGEDGVPWQSRSSSSNTSAGCGVPRRANRALR